ncbi:head GIN domain-containing protein [Flavobacterium pallidum]|uniref:DUF2807 domain-containing protein n=1 Tax=Flavobacterium pallidum TaxID=2172098 RepID=A0A2S1SI42_9FLAO|nr:head GIN domain-containing protein [Flavobacterium pallidum]AWI26012.1 DUF2807 domain-containing protein [Flavobacterium pallidum]
MTKAIILLTKIILIAALSLLFVSCRYNINLNDGVEGSGNVIIQTRNVTENFSGIRTGGGLEVVVEQGNAVQVKVEADDNIMPLVKTEVRDGVLVIETEGSFSSQNGPVITVTMPNIKELSVDGGGNLHSNGTLISDRLVLTSEGGASMDVNAEADKLVMDASGGGNIHARGKALDVEANASGGSPIDAEQLQANNVKADASGGGSISVYPILSLTADASGGGGISYHKIPKQLNKSESGGGWVSEQ